MTTPPDIASACANHRSQGVGWTAKCARCRSNAAKAHKTHFGDPDVICTTKVVYKVTSDRSVVDCKICLHFLQNNLVFSRASDNRGMRCFIEVPPLRDDDTPQTPSGQLCSHTGEGDVALKEYARFAKKVRSRAAGSAFFALFLLWPLGFMLYRLVCWILHLLFG